MIITDQDLNRYYRYAVALTGSKNDAFDLVHEAYLRVQGRLFLKKDAYFMTTIRNIFFDQRRRPDLNFQSIDEIDQESDRDKEIDLESVIGDQVDVQALLQKMTSQDRELIYLIEVEEYTYKEVAKLWKVPVGSLLSKLHRAKSRLKQWSEKNES